VSRTTRRGVRTTRCGGRSGSAMRSRRKEARGGLAGAAILDRDGGERRAPERRLGDVVVADHREVASRLEPDPAQAEHHPERDEVVEADRRGRRVGQRQQLADPFGAVLARRRAGDEAARVGRQPVRLERLAIALAPLDRARDPLVAAEHRDAAVAERDEVLGREIAAEAVVVPGEVHRHSGDPARDHDAGHAPAQDALERGRLGADRGGEDEAVGVVLAHRRDEAVLALRRLARVGEEDGAADLAQRQLDGGGQLGEIGIGELVDGDADGLRLLGPEARRAAVVDVAELRRRFEDAPARLVGDQRAFAQHERDRRGRDAGMLGDLALGQPLAAAAAAVRAHRRIR
jgi:hypothetical protein